MAYKILAINPGSTSTKIAVFDGDKEVFKQNVVHEAADLATAYAVSVTAPGIPNWRGIEVGSTRAAVLAAYPELDEAEQEKQNGTRDLLFWGRPVGGTFVGFRLENDVVVQMDSQFVFD